MTTYVPFIERFWGKVNKQGEDLCWLWTGSVSNGAGSIKNEMSTGSMAFTRASWLIHFGQPPRDKYVTHTCEEPLCVNPKHLVLLPSPNYAPFLTRFWGCVDKKGVEDCWLWVGKTLRRGYGRIACEGSRKHITTHRASWEIHNGAIPRGLHVLHRCDVPLCVNPNHLFLGNDFDNTQDRLSKKRFMHGEKNSQAKLTSKDVLEIRRLWRLGGYTRRDLGAMFGTDYTNVYTILAGKSWSHLL